MLILGSTSQAASAVRAGRSISLEAYTLRPGALFEALAAAARRGARVSVRLEGAPYGNAARANRLAVALLRRSGVDARLTQPADAPLHAKALEVDGTLFLDDRNWGADDLVLRDDDPGDPQLAVRKREALASEAALLRQARSGDEIVVESESFGCCNAVYSAIDAIAKRGLAPRVLVCARELRGNQREREMLAKLACDGARVRVTEETDKLALAGDQVWIGSANATAAIATPDTIDWSRRIADTAIVAAARARVESTWKNASPLV